MDLLLKYNRLIPKVKNALIGDVEDEANYEKYSRQGICIIVSIYTVICSVQTHGIWGKINILTQVYIYAFKNVKKQRVKSGEESQFFACS